MTIILPARIVAAHSPTPELAPFTTAASMTPGWSGRRSAAHSSFRHCSTRHWSNWTGSRRPTDQGRLGAVFALPRCGAKRWPGPG